jgi:hypothetical protein
MSAATTEVSVPSSSGYKIAVLDQGSEIAEAMRVNLSTGGAISAAMLERVSMPTGGSTVWTFQHNGNECSEQELIGVPVYFAPRVTLWPTLEPSGLGPVLVGNDLVTAHRVSDDLGDLDPDLLEEARIGDRTYSLEKLRYAQWGSGKDGVGKRIKESRILCLLRPDDAWPLLVQVAGMSVQPLSEFFMRLSVPYYQSIVGLSLVRVKNKSGQPYAQVKAKQVGKLTADEGRQLHSTYTEALRRMLQTGGSFTG